MIDIKIYDIHICIYDQYEINVDFNADKFVC